MEKKWDVLPPAGRVVVSMKSRNGKKNGGPAGSIIGMDLRCYIRVRRKSSDVVNPCAKCQNHLAQEMPCLLKLFKAIPSEISDVTTTCLTEGRKKQRTD